MNLLKVRTWPVNINSPRKMLGISGRFNKLTETGRHAEEMPEKPEEMTTSHSTYIHGSKANEQARLAALNEYLNSGYIGVVRPRRGDKILDVGSGPGQFTLMMGEMTGHGTSVLGIERDERQLEQARRMLGS